MENEVFSRSWKRQQNGFSPETSRKEYRPAGTLILSIEPAFEFLTSINNTLVVFQVTKVSAICWSSNSN